MPKQRVLVDSCVIIEAFRIHCWTALCVHFEVETVERCVEECCTGDPLLPGRVPIARDELTSSLTRIHAVDRTMLAALALDREDLPAIDDGELHLMAWLHANSGTSVTTVISTADRAAVRAIHVLQRLDQVTSLQSLGKTAGVGRKQLDTLQHHFSEDWLGTVRMQLRMGVL